MRIFSVIAKDNKKWKVFADNHAEVRDISVKLKKVNSAEKIIKIHDETEFYRRSSQYGNATQEALASITKGIGILELTHPIRWVIKQ